MGAFCGLMFLFLTLEGCHLTPDDGRMEVKKEAFDRGFMEKKIDKNDKVIYVWIKPKD